MFQAPDKVLLRFVKLESHRRDVSHRKMPFGDVVQEDRQQLTRVGLAFSEIRSTNCGTADILPILSNGLRSADFDAIACIKTLSDYRIGNA